MRGIPIFTFINKMDREAMDPFELIDQIENVLGIRTCPVNWPIGSERTLKVCMTVTQRQFPGLLRGQWT